MIYSMCQTKRLLRKSQEQEEQEEIGHGDTLVSLTLLMIISTKYRNKETETNQFTEVRSSV